MENATNTIDLNVFITSFNRQFLLLNQINNLFEFFKIQQVRINIVLLDASPKRFSLENEVAVPDHSVFQYVHSPHTKFYPSFEKSIDYLIEGCPVFLCSDEEFGAFSKQAIKAFNESQAMIGVPFYTIASRHADNVVSLSNGWLQLKAIAELRRSNHASDVALCFANQGIVSYYQLYSYDYFVKLAYFFSTLVIKIEKVKPNLERACETLWSLCNIFADQVYLGPLGAAYFRKLERRPEKKRAHSVDRFVEPVVHWIIWPDWRENQRELYDDIVKACSRFWSQISNEEVSRPLVEQLISLHASGYQQAHSRDWRSGFDYYVVDRPGSHEISRSSFRYHADHPAYEVPSRFKLNVIQEFLFRDDWVKHEMASSIFNFMNYSFWLLEEDKDIFK